MMLPLCVAIAPRPRYGRQGLMHAKDSDACTYALGGTTLNPSNRRHRFAIDNLDSVPRTCPPFGSNAEIFWAPKTRDME